MNLECFRSEFNRFSISKVLNTINNACYGIENLDGGEGVASSIPSDGGVGVASFIHSDGGVGVASSIHRDGGEGVASSIHSDGGVGVVSFIHSDGGVGVVSFMEERVWHHPSIPTKEIGFSSLTLCGGIKRT